jgi:hypothetical protein
VSKIWFPKTSKLGAGLQLQQSAGPAGQAREGYQSIRIESQTAFRVFADGVAPNVCTSRSCFDYLLRGVSGLVLSSSSPDHNAFSAKLPEEVRRPFPGSIPRTPGLKRSGLLVVTKHALGQPILACQEVTLRHCLPKALGNGKHIRGAFLHLKHVQYKDCWK